jgi:hypothetical protein
MIPITDVHSDRNSETFLIAQDFGMNMSTEHLMTLKAFLLLTQLIKTREDLTMPTSALAGLLPFFYLA